MSSVKIISYYDAGEINDMEAVMTVQESRSEPSVGKPRLAIRREMSARIAIGVLLATLFGCMAFVFWSGLTRY